jgi:cytochrome d ubiquinol oxidase subunit II
VLAITSFVPGVLWGVAFANIAVGLPINSQADYVGGFFNLLTPFTVLAGLAAAAFFTYHGAVFLTLRTKGKLHTKAMKSAKILAIVSFVLALLLLAYGYFAINPLMKIYVVAIAVLIMLSIIASMILTLTGKTGLAFIFNAITTVLSVICIFAALFPNVLVSSISPANNLTIFNASSNLHSLVIITIVAVILLPIILIYQVWCYIIFRHRLTGEKIEY